MKIKFYTQYLLTCILGVFIISGFKTYGQNISPKYEFRAAWIATVENIDWPTQRNLSSQEQKQEFINMLDLLKDVGINAIVMQIRPAADAFYYSKYEPWSQWLSGKQGKSPEPYYDPLEFMVKETHKRNMEFHAWFNPYRAVVNYKKTKTDSLHITNIKPEWFVDYGANKYFNPGLPEVRVFVTRVIQDVVRRYDIDAVHFDDYFYPYKRHNAEGEIINFPDSASFVKYNKKYPDSTILIQTFVGTDSTLVTEKIPDTTQIFLNKADWRRNNVDLIIEMLHDSIKSLKPYVKFGISPFGIWRNKKEDPNGSDTDGYTNYDGLYANILKWQKENMIDYVVPQLYWEIGKKVAAYEVLAEWWAKNTFGKHLYIGQGIYRVNSKNPEWKKPSQIPDQNRINRKYPEINGCVYFSAKVFKKNPNGVCDSLKNDFFKYPALIPPMPWIDSTPPELPRNLFTIKTKNHILLKWRKNETKGKSAIDTAVYWVVYRFPGKQIGSLNNPKNIYAVVREPYIKIPRYRALFRKKYTFAVTAVDRTHNESKPASKLIKNGK